MAAHKAAEESLAITSKVALHNFITAKFEATGLDEKHFDDFKRQYQAERQTLEILAKQPLDPETPKQ